MAAGLVEAIGFAGAALVCGSSVPQIVKTVRTRSAGDISWGYLAMFTTGTLFWLVYGVLAGAASVIAANVVAIFGYGALIVVKAMSDRAGRKQRPVAPTDIGIER